MHRQGMKVRRCPAAWLMIVGSLALAIVTGCATTRPVGPQDLSGQVGLASYYADRFHGRTTASGERYDRKAMTAAHRQLPFGTKVVVTNLINGRSVTVRINDRGPFVAGRVIDLSREAAAQLGMLRQGVVKVRVVPVARRGSP